MDVIASRLVPQSVRTALSPSRALGAVESAIARVVDRGLRHFIGDQRTDAIQGVVGRMVQGRSQTLTDLAERVVDQTIYNVFGERGAITQVKVEQALRSLFTDYPSRIVGAIETAISGRVTEALGGNTHTNREMWQLAIDRHVARSNENLRNIASELVQGRISPQQFRERMSAELRQLHIGASILGAGGIQNLSELHMRQLEDRLRQQIAFLNQFVTDVERRQARGLPLNNRDIARAGLYSGAGRVTFFQSQRQFMANSTNDEAVERRVLGDCENCPDCIELSSYGWEPAGTLPAIGTDTRCGHNCCCHFEFSMPDAQYAERPLTRHFGLLGDNNPDNVGDTVNYTVTELNDSEPEFV